MDSPETKEEVKLGRPSMYTQELADEICSLLAEGKSLRAICGLESEKNHKFPNKATIFRWLRTNEAFRDQYTRAKQESADALVDEMLDIADDGSNDLMTITKGDRDYEIENKEVTNRSRLRVDTRKWIASKLKPKKYGEKLDLTSDGKALPTPILANVIPSNNSPQEDLGAQEKN